MAHLGLIRQTGDAEIQTGTPGLQGRLFIPYTIAAPNGLDKQCRPKSSYLCRPSLVSRLPNARMLNNWLNIKNNSSRKRIQNGGMSCNRLCIPTFVV